MKIRMPKGISYKPLKELGIKEEEGAKILMAMMPFIDAEFKGKVRESFSDQEWEAVGKEGIKKGIKPEEGMFLLEEKYYAKTGRHFMELMRQLLNEYVVKIAGIMTQAKQDVEKYVKADKKEQQGLAELLEKKKWDEAGKLLTKIMEEI